MGSSIGFIGGLFSRILRGPSSHNNETSDNEEASSPRKVFHDLSQQFLCFINTLFKDDESDDDSGSYKNHVDRKDQTESAKRVSFTDVNTNDNARQENKFNNHTFNGPSSSSSSSDQLKAAIFTKPDISPEEYHFNNHLTVSHTVIVIDCVRYQYYVDLLATKVKPAAPDFNFVISLKFTTSNTPIYYFLLDTHTNHNILLLRLLAILSMKLPSLLNMCIHFFIYYYSETF